MIKIPIFKRTTIAALEFKFKRYQGVIEAAAFAAISGDSGDSFGVFRVFRQLRFRQNTRTRKQIYNPRHKHIRFGDYGMFKDSPTVYFYHNRSYE